MRPAQTIISGSYLMESEEEGKRLTLKTDRNAVIRQAAWAGIGPGMRVLDVGCGNGVATSALAELVGPEGHVTGLDFSAERLAEARATFGSAQVDFVQHDMTSPYLAELSYDAIWSRFFLEYFRENQRQVLINSIASLRPGGIACIADLDNNCLTHYGLSDRLLRTLEDVLGNLEKQHNFDPYAGRRLYGHFCQLGFEEIVCSGEMHHLMYGVATAAEEFNWLQKIKVVAQKSGCDFAEYGGDFELFYSEFKAFLNDPQHFTYTPLIIVRGIKP